MKIVKIAVYDEELEYVEMLCSFLKEWGRGTWVLSGYTDKKIMKKAVDSGRIDFVISTDLDILMEIQKDEGEISLLLLSDAKEENPIPEMIDHVYRFQSGRDIAEHIGHLLNRRGQQGEKELIGIYSPIGGCGKTRLAVDIAKGDKSGKYLYFGMEDFSSYETFSDTGEILYYIKERQKEKINNVICHCEGKLILGQGAFENRLFEKEDIVWFREILKESTYDGAVFDIGTGSVKDVGLFYHFDHIFIPILHGAYYDGKVAHFNQIIKLYDAEDLREKMTFVDMADERQQTEIIEKIMNGGIEIEKFGTGKVETS